MRLFLGLDLPPDIKDHIHRYLLPLQLSPKGWEDPHDYHQTLLFIGEAAVEDVAVIQERLRHFSFPVFNLTLGQFQFFNRRVMFLNFCPSNELIKLKHLVDETFPEWGGRSTKAFIPHITVKRWQRYEYDHLRNGLSERDFATRTFQVKSLCLFKSEKDVLNRKYHIIAEKLFNE